MRPDWFEVVARGNAWEGHQPRTRARTVGCWLRFRRWLRSHRLWGRA